VGREKMGAETVGLDKKNFRGGEGGGGGVAVNAAMKI